MINLPEKAPYLRNQRKFPFDDVRELSRQIDQAYIDIATKVNLRTIGVFAVNFNNITGEQWYLDGSSQKQQTLRQVYTFNSFTNFNPGINFNSVSTFTVIRGIGFDGTNYYPIPFANPVATGAIELFVSPTQVVFGVGATPPGIVSGIIILEWLSLF